jgi:hypothetical protein
MADTGQDCGRSEHLIHQLRLKDAQLAQQQAQLAHWQGWCQQLAAAPPSVALNAAAMLAVRQVCVSGLPGAVLEVRTPSQTYLRLELAWWCGRQ